MLAFLSPAPLPFFTSTLTTSFTPRNPIRHSLRCYTHPLPHATIIQPESTSTPHTTTTTTTTSSSSSSSTSSSSSNSISEFRARFNDLRGKSVEPVSATITRFNSSFTRPVPIVYRGVINELLTTTHLATVCAMWRFDAIFAYGFEAIFSEFLKYYPNDEERDFLYKSCVEALGLELPVIKEAAADVAQWLEGKSEEDVLNALSAASPGASIEQVGPVIEALAYIRDAGNFDWYYSRLFGIGLIQIMVVVGAELTSARAEAWAEKIGFEKSKFAAEMGNYLSSVERLKQAEQIFAEATAREAKKTAERLAAKAEAAAKEAEELERDEKETEEKSEEASQGSSSQDSSSQGSSS